MPQPNAVKCLVVDDEPRLRRVLVSLLESEGFTCSEAGSGTEALEMMHHDQLEDRVQEQAHRIEELSLERLQALVHFLEEKDPYTRGHSVRVANYALGIGRQLQLDQEVIDLIALGAELHDIGKIGVSEAVLHKAGKLSDAEYRHIMEHPVIGARILEPLMRDAPGALAIVRSHHERLDGKGFPEGLRGDAIPFEVRVVTVADSFDAMTSVRPYRPALSERNRVDRKSTRLNSSHRTISY